MNIGFYIDKLSDDINIANLCQEILNGYRERTIRDAAIFFNDVSHCKYNIPCATYNACDLWFFDGIVICSSYDGLDSLSKIINNIKPYFYYGISKINAIQLLRLDNINIICNGNDSLDEYKRLTNRNPLGVSENYKDILRILS